MTAKPIVKSRRVQTQISASLDHKLALAARESGISKSAYLRVALERELFQQEKLDREITDYQSSPLQKILP